MNDLSQGGSPPSQSPRRLVILTEGSSEPVSAKTAVSVLRYRAEQVVALLDSAQAGKTAQEVLGVGGSIPFVSELHEAVGANTLMIGIAPAGGRLPDAWRRVVLAAIEKNMDVVSGLHQFLSADPEFARAAAASGANLVDVRRNEERQVSSGLGFRQQCLRIHTVGQDCSVGKMLVAMELSCAMQRRGVDAKFVATGQTGILIEGDGCPIDCVVADFVSGAVEKLILENQHREVLFVEGQGSIAHPRYSAVTLGILHGCQPQGMILCYEAGRQYVHSMEHVPLKPLAELIAAYETMAGLMLPARVIGVAMNSRNLSDQAAEAERERVRNDLGIPVCDVIRHGAEDLLKPIEKLRREVAANSN